MASPKPAQGCPRLGARLVNGTTMGILPLT
jgi:hypothetical protein